MDFLQRLAHRGPKSRKKSTSLDFKDRNGPLNDEFIEAGGLEGSLSRNASGGESDMIDDPGELTFEEDTAGGLGRHLGLFSTTLLIIGRIIGTGIFSTPSSVTNSVGSVGAALMLWLLGGILSFCGLFVWLEFGCLFPRSGGEKVYLEAVYKRPKLLVTVIFATQAIFLGFTAGGCIVFASNILVAAGHTATAWNSRGIAIAVIIFVTILHTFRPGAGVQVMNFLGIVKLSIILFIVVSGWVVLAGGVHSIENPGASFHNAFADSTQSSGPYSTALFKVLNSYTGWSNAAYVLNEIKNPVRTLKIAGPLGLGICTILYLLVNISYFSAATPKQIAASSTTVASYFVKLVYGATAQKVISVFVALSALGNVLTVTFAQSRVNQELAKEGVIPAPKFWASNWPKGAPGAGLLLHFIPSFIVIVCIPAGDAYNFIVDVEGYPQAIINLLVVIGLFILRWRAPNLPRPFKVPLFVPFFFLVAQCFLIIAPFLRPPGGVGDTSLPYWLYPIVGIAVLIFGVLYWAVWRVLMPRLGNFEWVEGRSVLSDGTVVTVWEKERKD